MRVTDLIPWSRSRHQVPVRRNGGDRLGALQMDINRAFEDFWRGFDLPALGALDAGFLSGGLPRIDVRETDKAVEVEAELPGMDEADVDVSLAEGTLTIRGEKRSEREAEEHGYALRERTFGRIERVIPLPEGLDLDSAEATFKNGVLTVTIPRTEQAQSATKRIPVKQG